MAEPVDYFLQGASLGMRAAQFGAQAKQSNERMAEQRRQFDLRRGDQNEQFRTNFAERSRQFELNRQIALDELELRNKEYTLRQENAAINQSLQLAELYKTTAANQEIMRKAKQAKEFAPVLSTYGAQLSEWNGEGSPPAEPANLPKELREEATAMRFNAINVANNDRSLKLQYEAKANNQKIWNDGLEWMNTNRPELVTVNPQTGMAEYNWNEYTELRASAIRAAQKIEADKRILADAKTMAEINKLSPPPAGTPSFSEWWNSLKNPEILGIGSAQEALDFYRSQYGLPTPNNEVSKLDQIDKNSLLGTNLGPRLDPSLRYQTGYNSLLSTPPELYIDPSVKVQIDPSLGYQTMSPGGRNIVDRASIPLNTQ